MSPGFLEDRLNALSSKDSSIFFFFSFILFIKIFIAKQQEVTFGWRILMWDLL